MSVLRTKSVEQSIADTEEGEHQLDKALGPIDLTVIGVGVIIGTGIFVLTGEAAANLAGPSVAISFVVAGVVCALAALCYAEFASTVPVAGSAYTFAYASLGELFAWIIGWDLILELALGSATVASGWSDYLRVVMDETFGVNLPAFIDGEGHNLAAAGIVLVVTALLCVGIKVSNRVNAVVVAIKVTVVLLVIIAGFFYIKGGNYSPFVPPTGTEPQAASDPSLLEEIGLGTGSFGIGGIFTAAALVFFAYIGFDVVATAAEETKKPQRDMPIGIFGSLAICTTLYVLVSLVVTGMVPFDKIEVEAPLAAAFQSVGKDGIAQIISFGALAGLFTVMLILMLGQSRVFFAMSRDKLLPPFFSHVSPRFKTPYRSTLATGAVVALMAGLIPLSTLAQLVNIGTLFAFMVVAAGVIILRRNQPDLERAFRAPLVPFLPIALDPGLVLPDAEPAGRDLGAVPDLDGAGVRHLLRLRPPQEQAGARRARRLALDGAGVDGGLDLGPRSGWGPKPARHQVAPASIQGADSVPPGRPRPPPRTARTRCAAPGPRPPARPARRGPGISIGNMPSQRAARLQRPAAGPARGDPHRDPGLLHRPRLEVAVPVGGQLLQAVVQEHGPRLGVALLAEALGPELGRVGRAQPRAQDQAAAAEAVQRHGLARQLVRAAPGQRGDHRPDGHALGGHGHGGQRDPGIGHRAHRLAVLHVVPDEEAVPARLLGPRRPARPPRPAR